MLPRCPTPTPKSSRWRAPSARHAACLVLAACAVALTAGVPATRATPGGFTLDQVAARAQKLAEESYEDTRGVVPEWLSKISYDQWRDIRFRPEDTLWAKTRLPFQVQFFHPGLYYDRPVAINVVDAKGVHPLAFSPSKFDYGRNDFASKVPQNLGFAGFRIHAPIKKRDYFDEVIVFLGASYFRAVGKQQRFGASARGLAIDTALPSGEEFPYFREFWLVTPTPGAKEMTVYALLDSPSAAGAYKLVVKPGEQTTVAVEARLFLRREVRKLGLAPLTSMFLHGENSIRTVEDFRPESHDSDGLLLHFGTGEWLWRPIDNPRALNVSGFQMQSVDGFGLVQRDRDFVNYQDLETRSETRPSMWVATQGTWGPGRVELIEIPTKSDTNDNIVIYWVPERELKPGEPIAFAYTVFWYGDDPTRPPAGRVVATRRDRGTKDDAFRFVLDFAGTNLEAIPADRVLRGVVTVVGGEAAGEVLDQQVVKNPVSGAWRLSFQVRPAKKEPLELRAFLDEGGVTLTETWSYVVMP